MAIATPIVASHQDFLLLETQGPGPDAQFEVIRFDSESLPLRVPQLPLGLFAHAAGRGEDGRNEGHTTLSTKGLVDIVLGLLRRSCGRVRMKNRAAACTLVAVSTRVLLNQTHVYRNLRWEVRASVELCIGVSLRVTDPPDVIATPLFHSS